MDKEIVKVQMPLSGELDKALLYAKDRKRVLFQQITQDMVLKMKDRKKAFFYADYSFDKGWTLITEAPWQNW